MECPKCGFEQNHSPIECPRCGIIFAKFYRAQASPPQTAAIPEPCDRESSQGAEIAKELLFYVKPDTNPVFLAGRALLLLILAMWCFPFITSPIASNYAGNSFWHLVNLPFHEAGHIFARPFGHLFMSLGGTLGQLLMPAACLGVFLFKSRDTFGASVSLWWLGESFLDIAPYINDARDRQLMLLGGMTGREAAYGYHDWEYILGELGLSHLDHTLARTAHASGSLLMLAAVAWGGYLLVKQYKQAKNYGKNHPDSV